MKISPQRRVQVIDLPHELFKGHLESSQLLLHVRAELTWPQSSAGYAFTIMQRHLITADPLSSYSQRHLFRLVGHGSHSSSGCDTNHLSFLGRIIPAGKCGGQKHTLVCRSLCCGPTGAFRTVESISWQENPCIYLLCEPIGPPRRKESRATNPKDQMKCRDTTVFGPAWVALPEHSKHMHVHNFTRSLSKETRARS